MYPNYIELNFHRYQTELNCTLSYRFNAAIQIVDRIKTWSQLKKCPNKTYFKILQTDRRTKHIRRTLNTMSRCDASLLFNLDSIVTWCWWQTVDIIMKWTIKCRTWKKLQIQTKSDIIWQKKTIKWPENKHLNMKSIKMVMTMKRLQSVFDSELNKISQTFSNKQTNCNYNLTVIIAATVTIKISVWYNINYTLIMLFLW